MSRLAVLSGVTLAALAVVAVLVSSHDDDHASAPRAGPAMDPDPRCPKPRVTHLSVRSADERGFRVRVRMRAEVERGGVGSLHVTFRTRAAAILDIFGRRRVSATTPYTYPEPGSHQVSVVAEASTDGCRRYRKSEPATLRVRIPLAPRSPSSP